MKWLGAAVLLLLGILVLLPSFSCLSEGTLIETPAGPRPIETLRVGDAVLGLAPDGGLGVSRVTAVRRGFATWWRTVSLEDTRLELTAAHPVAAADGWRRALNLEVGDRIRTTRGFLSVRTAETHIGWRTVYDLSVEPHQNFIAAGVVVHNKSIRSRLAANEASALGDSRAVGSSQVAYSSSNGGYFGQLSCLAAPPSCGWLAGTTPFIDPQLGSLKPKQGYVRSFVAGAKGNGKPDPGILTFVYAAAPVKVGETGNRGFAIDHTGLICFTTDGSIPPIVNGALAPNCTPVR